MGKYDDIIELSRPASAKHPPMPRAERAKQFMPFAALRGYEETIEEKQVLYERRREMGEEQRDLLDQQLLALQARLRAGDHPRITAEYFVPRPDQKAEADPMGQYHTVTGWAEKMPSDLRCLVIDGIPFALETITGIWELEE